MRSDWLTQRPVVPAFEEVHNLVECLVKGRKYEPKLGNLKLHLLIRKVLNRFGSKDYDKLVEVLAKSKNKRLVEKYSREKPFKLLWKLALSEPKLVWLGKSLF